MPRDRLTFRERDVAAAIRSAERGSGRKVARISIGQDGSIIVELASSGANEPTPDPVNPWDEAVPNDYWKRRPKSQ
jgi:hypothetical protein